MDRHTFLFEEGTWHARGRFMDGEGNEFRAEGQAVITHGDDRWRNDGVMRVLGDDGPRFENLYEVEPFQDGSDITAWTSRNPDLGTLEGHFVVVGDSILSLYRSSDGSHRGTEIMRRLDDDYYAARGALLTSDGEKVSSWAVELLRRG